MNKLMKIKNFNKIIIALVIMSTSLIGAFGFINSVDAATYKGQKIVRVSKSGCGNLTLANGKHIPGSRLRRRAPTPPPPPPDQCSNISGRQTSVPSGMVKKWGWCVPAPVCSAGQIEIDGACSQVLGAVCKGPATVEIGDVADWTAGVVSNVPQKKYEWTGDIYGVKSGQIKTSNKVRIDTSTLGLATANLTIKSNGNSQEDTVVCETEVLAKSVGGQCESVGLDPVSGKKRVGVGTVGLPVNIRVDNVNDGYPGNANLNKDSVSGLEIFRSYDFTGAYTFFSGLVSGRSYEVENIIFNTPGPKLIQVTIESTRTSTVPGTLSCPIQICEPGETNCIYVAPAEVAEVTLANPITNNTCVANFSATNTGYCDSINLNTNEAIRFFDGDIPEGELPTSGMYKDTLYRVNRWTGQNPGEYLDNQSEKGSLGSTYNIEPSRHVIQCFNIDNYPTASNEFQCILNPDIRED